MRAETIPQLFLETVREKPRPDMYCVRDEAGDYEPVASEEVLRRVRALRLALESLGVERGDRVAILSENRLEWILSDLATLCCGAADVPIYPTLEANDIAYILGDCQPKAIFVSTAEQAGKIGEIRDRLPFLKDVVTFDAVQAPGTMSFARLLEIGENLLAKQPQDDADVCGPSAAGDVASILYTSGTTGNPKGVMLSHANFVENVKQALEIFPLRADDTALSFLPLSHAFERTCGYYAMMAAGMGVSFAGGVDTVGPDMLKTRPSIMICVPRLLDKIYDRVNTAAMGGSPIKRNIFVWAKKVVHDIRVANRRRVPPSAWTRFQHGIVDRLVFSKLRARTGGRLRFFVSGGAPLAPHVNEFFNAAGITCFEGYGLTETGPVLSGNVPGHQRVGSVGKALPRTEIRIAEDGEILARGPQLMLGYYNDEAATREVMTEDGWLMTGDIGRFDEDGYLYITDRKKELIVTAGGKNIAPQPIEGEFAKNKFISNAVVIGDQRPYLIALFVPNFDNLEAWATEHGLTWNGHDELERLPEVREKYQRALEFVNEKLPRFSTIKKYGLLRDEFTLESGELTPTLKIKRRVIQRKYHDVIEELYRG